MVPAKHARAILDDMRLLLLAVSALAACRASDDVSATPESTPANVLAQRLRVRAPGGSRVTAVWGEGGAAQRSPPVTVPPEGEAAVLLLGLRPSTTYRAVVEVDGPGGPAHSAPVEFTTGPLPAELADLALEVEGAPPAGYVLLNESGRVPGVLAAFDGQGALRWYHVFDVPAPAAEVKQLPGGDILAFVGSTPGWQPVSGAYVELAPSGEPLDTFGAAPPLFTDSHEALVTGHGTPAERRHVLGYELRTVDLGPLGLAGTGAVVGHTLQRLSPSGAVEFSWSAFDHLGLDELRNPSVPGQVVGVDFDHPNSIELDADGDYLVSFRDLDAVLLIDGQTGDVRWRLGGARSDFTFVGDPLGGFSGQHDARLLPGGHLLLLDNGTFHDPPTSRAVEYALDPERRTATLVWEHRLPPERWTQYAGSARRDAEGTTWIGQATLGIVDRVAPDGGVLWEARLVRGGQPAGFYRAIPIASLYGTEPPLRPSGYRASPARASGGNADGDGGSGRGWTGGGGLTAAGSRSGSSGMESQQAR